MVTKNHLKLANHNQTGSDLKPQCGKIQYTVEKNGVKKPW